MSISLARRGAVARRPSVATEPDGNYVEHSVFDPAQPYPFPVQTDTFAPTITTYAEGFYTYGDVPAGVEIVGARLWIPAGVTASSVDIHLYWSNAVMGTEEYMTRFYTYDHEVAQWMRNPTETITAPITGTNQWLEVRFSTPREVIKLAPIHLGQTFPNSGAVWLDGQAEDSVVAYDSFPVALAESWADSPLRNWRLIENEDVAESIGGRVHGFDVILRVPEESETGGE